MDTCTDHCITTHPHKKSCRLISDQVLVQVDALFGIIIGGGTETSGICRPYLLLCELLTTLVCGSKNYIPIRKKRF